MQRISRLPRRGAILLLTVAAPVALAAGASAGLLPGTTPSVYPQIPPQPGAATPPGCALPHPAPGTWTMLANNHDAAYAMQYVVDPGAPCVMYRTGDPHALERSTDHGRTWSPIFSDNAPLVPPSTSPFWGSSALVPRSGQVAVTEWGNGDGLVVSTDSGNSWTLRDQGIAGRKVIRIDVAASNPDVQYAVLAAPQDLHPGTPTNDQVRGLAVTADGGATWSQLSLPIDGSGPLSQPAQPTTVPALYQYELLLSIDPRDPSHVWLGEHPPTDTTAASSPTSNSAPWFLYESTDRGAHWNHTGILPTGVDQLVAIRSARHPLRLIAAGVMARGVGVAASDDDGATWRPILPGQGIVRPSPANSDDVLVMLYAQQWGAAYSADGLDTVVRVATPQVPVGAQLPAGFANGSPGGGVSAQGALVGMEPGDLLAADAGGTFYASFQAGCQSEIEPVCPGPGSSYSLWQFTPPTAAQIGAAPPPGRGGNSNWSGPPPVAPPLPTANGCTLPAAATGSAQKGLESGNVVFDGRDVLYTHYEEYVPQDYQAVIHAIDPLTCAKRPDIVVHFDPDDAPAWDAANAPAQLRHPWIDNATYDARRNILWAIVDDTTDDGNPNVLRGNNLTVGLFMIRVTDGTSDPRQATAQLAFMNGCDTALSYDQAHDTLWTCNGKSTVAADDNWAQLSAQTGAVVPSCATQIGVAAPSTVFPGVGTWAVTAPDRLYTWNEDDATFTEYETASCTPVAQYSHRPVVEPTNEDEQMACDTVSFAADSTKPAAPHGAMWLRDANGSSMTAYAIPDAHCPVQTVTAVHTAALLQAGATTPICVDLQHLSLGGSMPLTGRTVGLSVHGPTSASLPPATTTEQGRCVPWAPTVPGTYTVTATFDSAKAALDAEYLPSSATTTVEVTGVAGGAVAAPPWAIAALVEPPGAPPPPPSSGGVASAPSPAQAAAQAQAQAQAQTQSQAQAQTAAQAQPGVMVQRQRRTQVAVEQQAAGNTVYEARALRRPAPSPAWAAAAAFALAALVGRARRPRGACATGHTRTSGRSQPRQG